MKNVTAYKGVHMRTQLFRYDFIEKNWKEGIFIEVVFGKKRIMAVGFSFIFYDSSS